MEHFKTCPIFNEILTRDCTCGIPPMNKNNNENSWEEEFEKEFPPIKNSFGGHSLKTTRTDLCLNKKEVKKIKAFIHKVRDNAVVGERKRILREIGEWEKSDEPYEALTMRLSAITQKE